MKTRSRALGIVALSLCAVAAQAQLTGNWNVKSTFGGGDGWLAPGEGGYSFLGTGNLERGLAYNPVTGNLIMLSRNGGINVRKINGETGADFGNLDATGMSGGTFAGNMVGVGDDGAVYAANLATSATSPFKVYKWNSENDANPSTVVYEKNGDPVTRTGDAFAVRGSGGSTQFVAAGTTTTLNGNFTAGVLDGTNNSTIYTSIAGTTGASNDFRLGLTFVDGDTIIGTQGGSARQADFNGSSATVTNSYVFGAAQRALDYIEVGGVGYLAILDSNSSLVSVYDLSDLTAPLATMNATSGTLSANVGGTGSIAWGGVNNGVLSLYAMNTNQGIQAFELEVVPEPGTMLALGAGLAALARRRRKAA